MMYIGTSGFSYDDWKGHFYPDRISKNNMLSYYAERFDCVEVNSTYYTIPAPRSFSGMVTRTPPAFRFVIKAHRDMTHTEVFDPQVFDAFLGSIKPVIEARQLGCVLAQFPWSFKSNRENRDVLRLFRDQLKELSTVVEFRNVEWVNDETFELLRELKFGFCCVDEPRLKSLMPPIAEVTSEIAYIRFHGRNYEKWWQHDSQHERYDYLYSEEELAEWVPKVEDIVGKASDTYLFFNNHYRGKSAQNARMFANMLGLELPNPGKDHISRQMTLGEDL